MGTITKYTVVLISKDEALKRTMVSALLFAALFVGNETLSAQKNETESLEEIGRQLSKLLINRGDISETPFAICIVAVGAHPFK